MIAQVRELFSARYEKAKEQKKFDLFFEQIIESLKKGLKEQEAPIKFTELASTYSKDYSLFEEVVVAKLNAPCVEKSLRILIAEIEKEFGITIPIKPTSSFHLTVATKYRKPNPSINESVDALS